MNDEDRQKEIDQYKSSLTPEKRELFNLCKQFWQFQIDHNKEIKLQLKGRNENINEEGS